MIVARAIPPRTIRIANFVTTAVPSESHRAIIEPKLDLLREWVRRCEISDAPVQFTRRSWWRRIIGD